MPGRKMKYIDMDKINERIERGDVEPTDDEPVDVLYGTILDLFQLCEAEGMDTEEIDAVVDRIINYRAEQCRASFRLHTSED